MNLQLPTTAHPMVDSYVLAGNEALHPVYLAPPPPNSLTLPADSSNVILNHNAQAQNTRSFLTPMNWMNGQLGVPQNINTLDAPTQAVLVSGTPIPPHGEVCQVPYPGMAWATESGFKTCHLGEISSCFNTQSVSEKFQLWQHCKKLSKKHISGSPDTEALACLLIPFLRSLAHHRPDMRLEEGVCRAVKEWRQISNSKRMVYFKMAKKLMAFEEEDAAQIHNTQLPHVISAVSAGNNKAPVEKVDVPKKYTPQCPHPSNNQKKRNRPRVSEDSQEIPPEALAEYVENIDRLQNVKVDSKEENKNDNIVETPDLDLKQYLESLCEQPGFLSKPQDIIHQAFLEAFVYPDKTLNLKRPRNELEEDDEKMQPSNKHFK